MPSHFGVHHLLEHGAETGDGLGPRVSERRAHPPPLRL
jgi:hypothetical protein